MFISMALLTLVAACSKREDPALSDTLEWMDNTYNPHEGVSEAYGHGKTGWYAPVQQSSQASAISEYLVSGSTETFSANGCQISLRFQGNPSASTSAEILNLSLYTFKLGDMNPQSIKVNTYSHMGGFRCENYDPEQLKDYQMNCDHAEITLSTRNAAPLIDEESHATFIKLKGTDHESSSKSRGSSAFFEVDDVEYAARFAKALRKAVELCGGKASPY
jgi:hypothetical protein